MPKVIQVRDIPDDVHAVLSAAAEDEGLSLTRYLIRELSDIARRAQTVRDNSVVIRETQRQVRGRVDRETILAALRGGRPE